MAIFYKEKCAEYLLERHKELSARFDLFTSPGNGCPGFVQQIQLELRAIEASMKALAAISAPTPEAK